MKRKGILKLTTGLVCALILFSSGVCAEEEYDFGADEIYDALPDGVSDTLDDLGVTVENGGGGLTAENIFSYLWDIVVSSSAKPLTMLASVAAVIMLCSVTNAMNTDNGELNGVFGTVGILACSGLICTGFASVLETSKTAVESLSAFLSVYIPAFAGIMAINGQTATAAAYNGTVIVATQLLSQIFSAVVFPLTSCIMGISVAGAVDPDLKISNLSEGIKKLINWGLGLIMTIFAGLLSVQSFVGAASDTVSMKAVKFTVSGAIPIVGGAVSDALSTVKSSLHLLKAATGGFGIIASAAVILPVLISVVLFRISMMICASLSDLFGTSRLTPLLKSAESVLAIMIAVIVSFWTIAAVSTALILAISGGTV